MKYFLLFLTVIALTACHKCKTDCSLCLCKSEQQQTTMRSCNLPDDRPAPDVMLWGYDETDWDLRNQKMVCQDRGMSWEIDECSGKYGGTRGRLRCWKEN